MRNSRGYIEGTFILSLALAGQAMSATPPATLEDMWQVIQRQQAEIEALKQQLGEVDTKVEATGDALEEQRTAIRAPSWADRTHISGYGELHYNNLDNDRPGGDDKKEIDFHRFVLNIDHEFNDRTRFYSEVELEHSIAGDGQDGEIELEQAYIDFDLNQRHTARAGLFLVPVGILNETHEPPTFYGVERNPVENRIIPTTWWEGGAGLHGRFDTGWSYDLALHSGLAVEADDDFAVRGGRQKVSEADAEDLAATGRLRWTGMPGVELAATLQYQSDIGQSKIAGLGDATLFETHAVLERGPFGLRALYARWDLDGGAPAAVGADEQWGWYIEPSFRFTQAFGAFLRYNEWDNQAGNGGDTDFSQLDVGFNYWPHPDVVLKADYQIQDAPAGEDEFDGFNLGVGFQF